MLTVMPQHPTPRGEHLSRVLAFLTIVGGAVFLVTGAAVFIADWFSDYHFVRLWQQSSAFLGGTALLTAALLASSMLAVSRVLLSITGLLLLFAFWDSLDGAQQFLPTVSILLWLWAAIYIYILAEIWRTNEITTIRQKLAVGLSLLTISLYLGAAMYYIIINHTVGLVRIIGHPLYGSGIIFATILRWMGGIAPNTKSLKGKARVCNNCGLRNIPERSNCKRCGAALGEG